MIDVDSLAELPPSYAICWSALSCMLFRLLFDLLLPRFEASVVAPFLLVQVFNLLFFGTLFCLKSANRLWHYLQ